MRQIYAAILITLNGNYKNGGIANTQLLFKTAQVIVITTCNSPRSTVECAV